MGDYGHLDLTIKNGSDKKNYMQVGSRGGGDELRAKGGEELLKSELERRLGTEASHWVGGDPRRRPVTF